MAFQNMQNPINRREYEHSFHVLTEQMHQGKVKISSHLIHSIDGLKRVRLLPNNRINFLTIDEMARNLANSIAHMSEIKHSFEQENVDVDH